VKISQGWHVVGTVGSASEKISVPIIPCSEFQYSKPTVLILGNEASGLSPQIEQLCHSFLTVPPGQRLHPGIDSLNVSVSAGEHSPTFY
uniref:tRNA/rRNA methyltransferase SpoU type domain-containing protein n=1 Tax=Erpetoichthys calabaricus TaxID=27687 RepID=A0A8C4RZR2_ERPCA